MNNKFIFILNGEKKEVYAKDTLDAIKHIKNSYPTLVGELDVKQVKEQ